MDLAKHVAVLCTAFAPWALTATATAQTGGATVPVPIAPTPGATGYGAPGTRAIVVPPTALAGATVIVRGTMPGARHRGVILQRLDPKRGWRNERRGRVRTDERFLIRWRANPSGSTSLRTVIEARMRHRARPASSVPVATINVYRPAQATFFGPGLYGNTTACGELLTPALLGVANKQLPCGTRVAVLHDGREIVVPVVDRGPFHAGYSWDLTQATADALGFAASGPIGYIRLDGAPG